MLACREYLFHRVPLSAGGETGTFLSNQTLPKAILIACVCSLANIKKKEVLTRTLLLRRLLVGRLSGQFSMSRLLHLIGSRQPVGIVQQWRATACDRGFIWSNWRVPDGSERYRHDYTIHQSRLLFTSNQPSPLQVQSG